MNVSLSLLLDVLARTTLCTLLAGLFTVLLLSAFRVRSVRVERLAWICVLCQGWLIWKYPIESPHLVGMLATSPSGTSRHTFVVTAASAECHEDADTVWTEAPPGAQLAQGSLAAAFEEAPPLPAGDPASLQWVSWLPGVWLVGSLIAAALPLAGYVRFVRRLSEFECATGEWAAEWGQALREAGVSASIPLWTSRTDGPLLCRLPRGYVVIVPRETWGALTARQRRGVLRHELAHYQRGDIWKCVAARLLAWPQWFNPFIWHALRRFDECAERACDERVRELSPDGATDFARALLALAHPTGRPALASAAGGRGLAARVRRLLSNSERKESRMKAMCVCTALIVVSGLGAIRPGSLANDKDSSPGAAKPPTTEDDTGNDAQPAGPEEELRNPSAPRLQSQRANDEAYVDIKRLFDEEPGFTTGRDELKRSLADTDIELKRLLEELRSLGIRVRDAGAEGEAGQKERDQLHRKAQDAKSSIESKRESVKIMALEREADLYRETYERIRAAIADYARDNGIRIVRRKQAAVPERLDAAANPQDLIRLMNQDVLFNADEPRDITEPVLQLLKSRAAAAK